MASFEPHPLPMLEVLCALFLCQEPCKTHQDRLVGSDGMDLSLSFPIHKIGMRVVLSAQVLERRPPSTEPGMLWGCLGSLWNELGSLPALCGPYSGHSSSLGNICLGGMEKSPQVALHLPVARSLFSFQLKLKQKTQSISSTASARTICLVTLGEIQQIIVESGCGDPLGVLSITVHVCSMVITFPARCWGSEAAGVFPHFQRRLSSYLFTYSIGHAPNNPL